MQKVDLQLFFPIFKAFFAIFEQRIWRWLRFWIAWISFTPLPFFTPTVIYLVIYRIFYFNYKATTKTYKHKYKNWIWIIVN